MSVLGDIFRWIVLPKFFKAGFSFESDGGLEGWLTRDPYNSDWILWSPTTRQLYRKSDGQKTWLPSPENEVETLKLGRVYAEIKGIRW